MKKIEIIPHGWIVVRYMYPYLTLLIIPVIRGIFIKNTLSQFLYLEALAIIFAFLVSSIKRIKFHCLLAENGVFIKSGLFIKKECFIETQRATVISIERNWLLKIFKTANLKIYGSFGKKKEKILDIPVTLKYAKEIEKLYSIKPHNLIFEQSFFKTLISSATDTPLSVGILILIPLINQISKILGKEIKDIVVTEFINQEFKLSLFQKGLKWVTLILILAYFISFLNSALKNINFKIYKQGETILIKAGVIPKRSICFNSENVLAATVHKKPIFRLFGLCSVRVSIGGFGTETRENCLLLPLVNFKLAQLFFSIYFPKINLSEAEIKHPKTSLPRFLRQPFIIIPVCFLIFLFIGKKFKSLNTLLRFFCFLIFCFCALLLFCRHYFYKNGGVSINRNNVSALTHKIFSQTELHFKTENTEMIKLTTSPFDRRKNLIKLKFFVFGKNKNRIKIKNLSQNLVNTDILSRFL